MLTIGLIREEHDNRVAFTPSQARWINEHHQQVNIVAQPSPSRCFTDEEYRRAGIPLLEDLSHCDILLGIKEVPPARLIPGKTYLFFSHTKKKQAANQSMLQTILDNNIRLVDYECLVHPDGQRILGFGFFAGVVGAHNGLLTYGKRTGLYDMQPVHTNHDFKSLIHQYFGFKVPPVKIVLTGSGRVASGVLEIMGLLGIKYITPEEFLHTPHFTYPVYTQLKAGELYVHKKTKTYSREDFHTNPAAYECRFLPFTAASDILMNGIYWDRNIPPLFHWEDLTNPQFRIQAIADITDDTHGSVPCNLGDSTIQDPIYGVDKHSRQRTAPGLPGSIDMMCVSNLPNELPRDASLYFGDQLMKYVFEELLLPQSDMIAQATIAEKGQLTATYSYLEGYVKSKV